MVGLVAFNFILRFILAAAMDVPLIVNVLGVDLDDLAADMSGFRIPGHVIVDFETFSCQRYLRYV